MDCPDEQKFADVRALYEHFRRRHQVVDVDGARVIFPDGWGLVRTSNTQPVLVLRCEGRTEAALRNACAEMADALALTAGIPVVRWD